MPVLIANARITTGDPRRPWVDAVVCDGPRVLAIGSSAELRKRFGTDVRVIDAKGAIIDLTAPSTFQHITKLAEVAD